jgi:MFS family permease
MLFLSNIMSIDSNMELKMSFREKLHWAAFVGIAGAFGWYFLTYPWAIVGTRAGVGAIGGMLVPVTLIIVALMSVTAGYLAIRFPKEAHLKEDERERSIHLRGTHAAYYPLVIGSYGLLIAMFNQLSMALLINLLLAVVMSAELVRVGAQLWFYRRES